VKEIDPADADRAQRVAVIRLLNGDEPGLSKPPPAALLPVLEGHLQGDLDSRRAVVGVEDLGEPVRRDPDERLGQLDGRRVREAEESGMSDLGKLRPDGPIDQWLPVSVYIDPQ